MTTTNLQQPSLDGDQPKYMTEEEVRALLYAEMRNIDVGLARSGGNIDWNNNIANKNPFHWFTLFESIDGYSQSAAGTGSVTLTDGYVALKSGNLANNTTRLDKISSYNITDLTWDKPRRIRMCVRFNTVGSNTMRICTGDPTAGNAEKIGFLLSNATLYGQTGAGGVSSTEIDLGVTISSGDDKNLEIYYDPVKKKCDFYVNGILKGTSITDLPTGTSKAGWFFGGYVKSDANAETELRVGFYDFWQSM